MTPELTPDQQARAEALIEGLLAIDPAERGAMLAACADPAVGAEVASLLAARPLADRILDRPIADSAVLAEAIAGLAQVSNPDAAMPERVGPYRLIARIGEGGMGAVYSADQSAPLQRRVAVKLIKPGMDSQAVLKRFDTERQALAMMNHPHVARALDAGVTAEGRPYFVMELVDGVAITTYCDEQRLGPHQRLALFLQVCAALQHAHQKGVIHRDIKPSNVLVTRESGVAVVKVIDFGVARATGPGWEAYTGVTEHGLLIGTPEYMSPEQAGSTDGDIDTRADIYALGVLLYELLVGSAPLDIGSSTQLGVEGVRRRICEDDPLRPSTRLTRLGSAAEEVARRRGTTPTALHRAVRGDLDWIVMKCLERARDRRYSSVAELVADIERYSADEPVIAGPPSATYRITKFVRRNRVWVGAGVVVAVVLVIGVISTATFALRADRQRTTAEQQAAVARTVVGFLNAMLASVDPRDKGVDVTVRTVLDEAAGRVAAELAEQPAVEREVRGSIGHAYQALGLYDAALPHLLRAHQLAVGLRGIDHPDSVVPANDLGVIYRHLGRFAEAEDLHRQALSAARRHHGDHDMLTANTMNLLANVLFDDGQYDEGRDLYVAAYTIRAAHHQDAQPEFISAINNLARERYTAGDYPAADALFTEALTLARRLYGDDHVETVGHINNVAFMRLTQGHYDEAERLFREAAQQYRRIYGGTHPDVARVLNNLGESQRRAGRYGDALQSHQEALAMRRAALGAGHPLVAVSLNNTANTLTHLERYGEAIAAHEQALAIRRQSLGERHPDVATSLGNLASVHLATAHPEAALAFLEEGLDIRRGTWGDDHPLVANTRMGLARCLLAMERLQEADAHGRAALAVHVATLGADHPDTAANQHLLGRILARAGQRDEAEHLLRSAQATWVQRLDAAAPQLREVQDDLAALQADGSEAEEP